MDFSGRQGAVAPQSALHSAAINDNHSNAKHSAHHESIEVLESLMGSEKSSRNNQGMNSDAPIRTGIFRKLGPWLILLAVGSIIALFVSAGFISWLWWSNRDNYYWRRIMLSQYFIRIVTLLSIVIRTAIATLAGIGTSMIASIAVEGRGVPLLNIAELSIARFSNHGPTALLSLIFARRTLEFFLRVFALLLVVNTIAAQFASTLLLTDVVEDSIVSSFSRQNTVSVGFPSSTAEALQKGVRAVMPGSAFNYWIQRPSLFPTFAEYAGPKPPTKDGVDDTGPVVRAFLPVQIQAERESIESYNGLARVIDARTVCIQPEITKLSFNLDNLDGSVGTSISGVVKPAKMIEDLVFWDKSDSDGRYGAGFYCSETPHYQSESTWQMCPLGDGGLYSIFTNGSATNASTTMYVGSTSAGKLPGVAFGRSWLVWNSGNASLSDSSHGLDGLVAQITSKSSTGFPMKLEGARNFGPWLEQRAVLENGTARLAMQIKASWCFESFV
jgi:hypothetical protein